MKRLAPLIGFLFTLSVSHAAPIYHPSGPALVYGDVSNGRNIMSNISNPATAATTYKTGDGELSIGIIPSFGGGAEIGDVNNIITEVDAKSDQFSDVLSRITIATGDAAIAAEANTLITDTNSLLETIENNGYVKGFLSAHVIPITWSSDLFGGALTFDVSTSVIGRLGLLRDSIDFDAGTLEADIGTITPPVTTTCSVASPCTVTNGDVVILSDGTNIEFRARNDSVAVLKAAMQTEFALGYSREVWNNPNGNLYAGAKARVYQVELVRDIVRLDTNTNSEDLLDNITDADRNSSNGFGIDLGAMWIASDYHLGVTLTNINEPEFDYNTYAFTTSATPTGVQFLENGRVANLLSQTETYTMESQLKLEGAYYLFDKQLMLGAAVDANATTDPFGDEYKWGVVSIAYDPDWWFIPSIRGGLRKNMEGSQISYFTFGITFFAINLDLAYSSDSVEDDGDSVPRGFMLNIGTGFTF